MKGSKYIIFDNGDFLRPVIFPATITHDKVASHLAPIFGKPVSAGFYNGSECSGKSTSLNLESMPVDADLIRRMNAFEL